MDMPSAMPRLSRYRANGSLRHFQAHVCIVSAFAFSFSAEFEAAATSQDPATRDLVRINLLAQLKQTRDHDHHALDELPSIRIHSMLMVTHDLKGLDGFDMISIVERGTVLESGSHAELLEISGGQ